MRSRRSRRSLPPLLLIAAAPIGCDRGTPAAPDPGSGAPAATAPASRVADSTDAMSIDDLLAQLEDLDPQVRLAACGELAGFADEPAVVPRLYLRLIDEDEDPAVKLAAVESLIAIGGGAASKTVHAWFYGRPEPTDAWSRAGDWLIEQLGAEQIAMDLDSIARRDQSTRRLILRLARRHDSLPPMAALVERLSQSAPPGP